MNNNNNNYSSHKQSSDDGKEIDNKLEQQKGRHTKTVLLFMLTINLSLLKLNWNPSRVYVCACTSYISIAIDIHKHFSRTKVRFSEIPMTEWFFLRFRLVCIVLCFMCFCLAFLKEQVDMSFCLKVS